MKTALLPGDGIGPEMMGATRAVLEAVDRMHGPGTRAFAAKLAAVIGEPEVRLPHCMQ